MYFHEAKEQFGDPAVPSWAPACTFVFVLCVFAINLYPITV